MAERVVLNPPEVLLCSTEAKGAGQVRGGRGCSQQQKTAARGELPGYQKFKDQLHLRNGFQVLSPNGDQENI